MIINDMHTLFFPLDHFSRGRHRNRIGTKRSSGKKKRMFAIKRNTELPDPVARNRHVHCTQMHGVPCLFTCQRCLAKYLSIYSWFGVFAGSLLIFLSSLLLLFFAASFMFPISVSVVVCLCSLIFSLHCSMYRIAIFNLLC